MEGSSKWIEISKIIIISYSCLLLCDCIFTLHALNNYSHVIFLGFCVSYALVQLDLWDLLYNYRKSDVFLIESGVELFDNQKIPCRLQGISWRLFLSWDLEKSLLVQQLIWDEWNNCWNPGLMFRKVHIFDWEYKNSDLNLTIFSLLR